MMSFSLIVALLIDGLFGELPNKYHPLCVFGRLARWNESWTKAKFGKTFWAGVLAGGISFLLPIGGVLWLLRDRASIWNWVVFTLVLYFSLGLRSLVEHGLSVRDALSHEDMDESRKALSLIVGRDTAALDRSGVWRATIESISENLTDAVIAPLFYGFVGILLNSPEWGITLILLQRFANTLDALWGKRNDEYRYFGTFVARLDDVLNFIPARLAYVMISVTAGWLPYASGKRAWQMGWKYRKAHASPNSPWSEAAYAGALDLKLSGPVYYKGELSPYPYLGEGRLDPTLEDFKHTLWLTVMTTLVTAICMLGILFSLS